MVIVCYVHMQFNKKGANNISSEVILKTNQTFKHKTAVKNMNSIFIQSLYHFLDRFY